MAQITLVPGIKINESSCFLSYFQIFHLKCEGLLGLVNKVHLKKIQQFANQTKRGIY